MDMEIDLIVNVSNKRPMTLTSLQHDTSIGDYDSLAMSLPEALFASVSLSIVTVSTIIGNILVILSVFTYKPLRIAQNFFLVSLAVADLTVAVLVLPFNITQSLMGRWTFGLPLCEMWLTCDVLCCTASILNLCAIALDRYWAIHDPINYAQKRTLKRVVIMIFLVWIISCIICLPPLFGWNDWTHDFNEYSQCKLTSQRGYVIYSACGSFFIPLIVMATVYFKIFVATKRRLRERARNTAAVAILNQQSSCSGKFCKPSSEPNSLPSSKEANHNDVTTKTGGGGDDSPTPLPPLEVPATLRTMVLPQCMEESVSEVQQLHLHKVDSKASENSPIHQFIEERQKISLSKERRAARILGIVMGVFVVCWLPFFLMYVVVPFCKRCSLSYRIENFITWMGYVNSALNPVIYTIFNIDFRRAFTRLLHCNSFL